MKILLVDDSKKHRKAGQAQLEALGHEVIALSDYTEAVELVRKGERFDAALLDLLMPAEATTLGGEGLNFLGQPIDVGYSLTIKLAIEGIPMVAVATDTNHHSHPASAIMDWFIGKEITINGSRVLLMHSPMTGEDYKIKDWAKVLARLKGGEE